MSTSSQLGQIQGLPTSADIDDSGAYTSTFRDLCNNLNHHADQRSRVLVSYPQRSATTGGLGGKGTVVAGTWERLYSWGPFPILVGHDGLPYPIRARVGGRSVGGATSTLRIGACLPGRADADMQATTAPANVIEVAPFTDATNQWRDPSAAKTTLTLDASFLPTSYAMVDGVGTTLPGSVAAVLVVIEVWGFTSVPGNVVCTQVYAAEQVPVYP
jgi:hypothetical protein